MAEVQIRYLTQAEIINEIFNLELVNINHWKNVIIIGIANNRKGKN